MLPIITAAFGSLIQNYVFLIVFVEPLMVSEKSLLQLQFRVCVCMPDSVHCAGHKLYI